jgi:hypothetical protein
MDVARVLAMARVRATPMKAGDDHQATLYTLVRFF